VGLKGLYFKGEEKRVRSDYGIFPELLYHYSLDMLEYKSKLIVRNINV